MTKPLTLEEAVETASNSDLGYTDDAMLLAELGSVSLSANLCDVLDDYNNSDGTEPFIEFVIQDLKETLEDALEELASFRANKEEKTQTVYARVDSHYNLTIPADIDMEEHRVRDEADGLQIVNEETDEVVLFISYGNEDACRYNDGGVDYYVVK